MTTTTQNHRLGIEVEQRGRVLLARLHGGPRGEFGPEIAADLEALVTRAETDEGVGAVVITGTHPERFVAHANLRWLQEGGAASPSVGPRGASAVVHTARATRAVAGVRKLADRTPLSGAMELLDVHETFLRMNRCGAVFVAALNGSALGIGSELALACDYRLMAAGDHVIGQPEILLGFPPGGGGTQRLVRLVGTHQGLKRMLDGGGLDPEAAAEIGYVDEVIPADELIDAAVALADRLAQRLKFTVAAVKRAAYIGGSLGLEEGLHVENAEFLSTLASPGAQAAMLAYMKRTEEIGDLPLYDRPTYEHTLEAGSFGRTHGGLSMIKTEPVDAASQSAAATTTWKNAPTQTLDVGGTSFAYRELGPRGGTPLVFLHHFTAVLDDWDPRVIDGIAAERHVITFDNRGIGASGGKVPHTLDAMAADAAAFIRALGHEHVDLLGFSIGGGVAQEITLDASRARPPADPGRHGRARWRRPDEDAADRRRRVPQGGADPPRPTALPVLQPQPGGQARRDGVHRPSAGAHNRPRQARSPTQARIAQLKAIREAGLGDPRDLSQITQPTFVANGDNDVMVASSQSHELAERIPNAKLTIYPDSGHGGIFQYHEQFVPAVLEFLES